LAAEIASIPSAKALVASAASTFTSVGSFVGKNAVIVGIIQLIPGLGEVEDAAIGLSEGVAVIMAAVKLTSAAGALYATVAKCYSAVTGAN
jgi:hypothetical protein